MHLSPGMRLGAYQVEAALGAGGMGEVYRARDTRLDRTVAIKVLSSHAVADAQARERFVREGRAIAALNHPNICALYDIGDTAGSASDSPIFLVMELNRVSA
jgi:serine/threonine protein kinase